MDSATRPGWKTSEGQASILAIIGAAVTVLAGLPTAVQVAVVAAAGLVLTAYVLSRGTVKRNAMNAGLADPPTTGDTAAASKGS